MKRFSPTCYLVEVSQDAGVKGPLIEGDLLVVDEARVPQHDDLVIAAIENEQRLYKAFRIGGSLRLITDRG